MKKRQIFSLLAKASFLLLTPLVITSCDDNEGGLNGEAIVKGKGEYFIAVKAASGTEYVMQAESLTEQDLDIKNNVMELPQSEYTWIFKKDLAIGLVYQQQFAGIGYGLRYLPDSSLEKKIGRAHV